MPVIERLASEGYAPEVSERVYATLAERACLAIREGHSAIVDAVYTHPADRLAIEQIAARESVPFVGFWLEAPASTLIARTEQRHGDPSDANADVVRMQRTRQTGDIGWHHLDASGPADFVLDSAAAYMQRHAQRALNIDTRAPG